MKYKSKSTTENYGVKYSKWKDDECYDRIMALITHDSNYNYMGKYNLIGFMLKNVNYTGGM